MVDPLSTPVTPVSKHIRRSDFVILQTIRTVCTLTIQAVERIRNEKAGARHRPFMNDHSASACSFGVSPRALKVDPDVIVITDDPGIMAGRD